MLDTPLKEGLISTLYNVSGIMFSIGLGLIVSFNLSGIRNREYIKEIRKNIANIRDIFISYFIISTLIYITNINSCFIKKFSFLSQIIRLC